MIDLDPNHLACESVFLTTTQPSLWASIEVHERKIKKGLVEEFEFVPESVRKHCRVLKQRYRCSD